MKTRSWKTLGTMLIGALAIFSISACDDNEPMGKGDVDFEITDAPSDDASVKAVFVTVAGLKVDGEPVPGFTKQTIDLMAYQEGNTKLLFTGNQLDAKSYNNLTLIMDANTDASGNEPGCYVQTIDNTKYKLKNTANNTFDIVVNKGWMVSRNAKSKVVIDFELRKALKYSSDPVIKYQFVSDDELSTAIRIVNKETSGTITGSFEADSDVDADKIIVYAYKKGTFNQSTETTAQGDGQIFFSGASASAEVKQGLSGKTFKLALLNVGEYELHFARYKQPTDGPMNYEGMLTSTTSINGSLAGAITIQAGATINVMAIIDVL